ncbi:STAS domain-containing protein [Streptomyces sp. NBC_00306]|uniref:STAS domain-containing protein n=1 Tax=Streptomyces sp. NBC_00306 TaxID=2975708 RepID=UPI002E28A44D|nr:STAS domain-containing protein [Streptomyces sp. NBC_00306]
MSAALHRAWHPVPGMRADRHRMPISTARAALVRHLWTNHFWPGLYGCHVGMSSGRPTRATAWGDGCHAPHHGAHAGGSHMDITTTAGPGPGHAVMKLAGELDISTVGDIRAALAAAVTAYRQVVIDLGDLSFCDCSGIGALVAAKNSAARRGTHLTVRNIPDHLARLLHITGTPLPATPGTSLTIGGAAHHFPQGTAA